MRTQALTADGGRIAQAICVGGFDSLHKESTTYSATRKLFVAEFRCSSKDR